MFHLCHQQRGESMEVGSSDWFQENCLHLNAQLILPQCATSWWLWGNRIKSFNVFLLQDFWNKDALLLLSIYDAYHLKWVSGWEIPATLEKMLSDCLECYLEGFAYHTEVHNSECRADSTTVKIDNKNIRSFFLDWFQCICRAFIHWQPMTYLYGTKEFSMAKPKNTSCPLSN